jgi:hypothetical protein
MVLLDGYLNYRSLTIQEFIDESITWTNIGSVGVICDDQEQAISDLYIPLININTANGRDLRIFDANDDLIRVYSQYPDNVPYFSDHIYDWMWEKDNNYEDPPTNVLSNISYELIKDEAIEEGYYSLFFFKFPDHLEGIDFTASQISKDYTYSSTYDQQNKHMRLKRELYKYYIYNQDEERIYDFKTFS